jgi:hypothetical protein
MASSIPSFTGPGGVDAATHILKLGSAARPIVSEVLYAGQRQKTRIVQRTAAGKDSDGVTFAPYSPDYAKRKAKAGHSTTVNLFGIKNHPHMMNRIVVLAAGSPGHPADMLQLAFQGEESLRARVHNEGATIRRRVKIRTASKKKSFAKTATFRIPRRHFWDASAQERVEMVNDIGHAMSVRMRTV